MTEYKNNPKQDKFINLLLLFALLLCITLLALLTRQIIGLQNYIQTSMEHFEEVIHQQGNVEKKQVIKIIPEAFQLLKTHPYLAICRMQR